MKHLLVLFVLIFSSAAWTAIPNTTAKTQKVIVGSGALSGGLAGSGFSLLNVRSAVNRQARLERLMIDIGDIDGRPQKGLPGYFNVELQNNAKRIVVDFSQMPITQIELKKVKERLKNSLYVKDMKMLEDPSDNTLSLILDLHRPIKLKVFQVAGAKSTAKVVLDMRP